MNRKFQILESGSLEGKRGTILPSLYNEMKRQWQLASVVLMYRINWKNLLFLLAITTTAGMLLQTYSLPYPVSSFTSLNSRAFPLAETLSLESSEQFDQFVPSAPVVYLNSSTVQSIHVVDGGAQRNSSSRRRRRRNAKTDKSNEQKAVSCPPPPRNPPTRLQVELLKY